MTIFESRIRVLRSILELENLSVLSVKPFVHCSTIDVRPLPRSLPKNGDSHQLPWSKKGRTCFTPSPIKLYPTNTWHILNHSHTLGTGDYIHVRDTVANTLVYVDEALLRWLTESLVSNRKNADTCFTTILKLLILKAIEKIVYAPKMVGHVIKSLLNTPGFIALAAALMKCKITPTNQRADKNWQKTPAIFSKQQQSANQKGPQCIEIKAISYPRTS